MTDKNYLRLSDIEAYMVAFNLSNYTWKIVLNWDYLARDTVGKQWVRAVDSISANIAEGFGRYNKKDKIKFYRYSFGSVKESLDWLQKAKIRGLVSLQEYDYIFMELNKLPLLINQFIKFTNLRLKE
jgi:four helix bundle protein